MSYELLPSSLKNRNYFHLGSSLKNRNFLMFICVFFIYFVHHFIFYDDIIVLIILFSYILNILCYQFNIDSILVLKYVCFNDDNFIRCRDLTCKCRN